MCLFVSLPVTPEDDVIAEWLLRRRRQGPKQPELHQWPCVRVCVSEVQSRCKYFAVFHGIAVVCPHRLPWQLCCHSHWRREGLSDVERGREKDAVFI